MGTRTRVWIISTFEEEVFEEKLLVRVSTDGWFCTEYSCAIIAREASLVLFPKCFKVRET